MRVSVLRGQAPDVSVKRLPAWAIALLAATALALTVAASAQAVILPAATIDGPSESIAGFGGVAMAEDGTGGLVYLKRIGGVAHVFVSRYLHGQWQPPIRVDTEEPYAASWPRIGAAEGGELLVVWATTFASREGKLVYELLGSELGPGGESFGPASFIDQNIGEATGTSPDIAMSSSGQADVVYRVVSTNTEEIAQVPLLRRGDVVEQVRAAHYGGGRWSNLGEINRDPNVSMRPPTSSNAPKVAIGPTGSGVVVWQEPDVEGVARIWARRVFGTSVDYVMPASTTAYHGVPMSDDADAPAVAFSRLGQAEVAYRQLASPGSPLPGPRIFLNVLSDGEATNGAEFEGAMIPDPNVPGGKSASVGPPSIDIDEQQDMRLLYDANGVPRVIEGNDRGLSGSLSLGSPFAAAEPSAESVMNPEGGGVSAWPSVEADGNPAVAVREDFPNGAVQTALLTGGAGGEIGELAVGRSGLGDGLVAFRQGALGDAAIVAVQATAPPAEFVLSAPKGWVRPAAARVSWLAAPSADGPLAYHVALDGHVLATPAGAMQMKIDTRGVASGKHRVQALATDADGQDTLTAASQLLIDGTPPTVEVNVSHRRALVAVTVRDPDSGVEVHATSVSFGDGHDARGRARFRHRYAHGGVYRVTASVSDRLGNRRTFSRWVSVP
jgi:PKD domain